MKWKTKKNIYTINKFTSENFFEFFLAVVGAFVIVFLLGDFPNISLFFFLGLMMILYVIPWILYIFAKRHSYKYFPIIRKIKGVNDFRNRMSYGYSSIGMLIYEVEAACFDEDDTKHQNLRSVLTQYIDEIEHIYIISKNSNQSEEGVKKVAVKRAHIIIRLLKASVKKDKEQSEKINQFDIEAIEKEWNETYINSSKQRFEGVVEKKI